MTKESIKQYTHYLAFLRLKNIGIKTDKFPRIINPYVHLEKQSGTEDETSNRVNNFEGTSINYKSPEILSDWDKI
jgi:ribonucleotide reductase beta subunit family protein with ferritin-like domain